MNDYYDEDAPTKRPEDGESKPGEGMPLRGDDLEDAPATKPENDAEDELRRRAPLHYRPADFDDAPTIPCDEGGGSVLARRYHILKQLGQGGMGSVYLAEDLELDKKLFAIKMLPSVLVANEAAYRQLKGEALMAMKLVHTNIVQIRAFEENGGNPFIVMDYIEGKTLSACLAEWGKLSAEETAALLKPVAAAIDYAHSQKVVHRDIKPGNVLIRNDGVPFVLDFGIAREIRETMTRVTGRSSGGTLLYMSPEQLHGRAPKPAQDVYSFAAMAYECMKGEPPFVRGQVEYQIDNDSPEPLPEGTPIAAGVMAGLAKKPEDRPASCMAVIEGNGFSRVERAGHVEGVLGTGNGGHPAAQQPPADEIYVKPVKPKTGLLLAGAAALAVAVLGGWWFGRSGKSGERLRSHSATNATVVISENAGPAPIPSPAPAPAKPAPAPTLQQGETRTLTLPGGAAMKMIYVAPGSFTMGSPKSEDGRDNDETQHRVTLTKGYWLGETEVTQGQWKSVMGGETVEDLARKAYYDDTKYPYLDGKTLKDFCGWKSVADAVATCGDIDDDTPVYYVSWHDAKRFCERVNKMERDAGRLPAGCEYRLPTEAEWEYACRAGTGTALPNGMEMKIEGKNKAPALDDIAWYGGNSSEGYKGRRGLNTASWPEKHYPGGTAHACRVKGKDANSWGFYDMIGNVWEWCEDKYGEYPSHSVTDPSGPASGGNRVLRGGSWINYARCCRSAFRIRSDPGGRDGGLGFRLARSAGPRGQGAEQ